MELPVPNRRGFYYHIDATGTVPRKASCSEAVLEVDSRAHTAKNGPGKNIAHRQDITLIDDNFRLEDPTGKDNWPREAGGCAPKQRDFKCVLDAKSAVRERRHITWLKL